MADGKGKFLKRNLLAPYEIIAKKPISLSPFPLKEFLPLIHEQQLLHSTINEAITKPFSSSRVFVDEKLNFEDRGTTDESFLEVTDKETCITLYMILPSISNFS